MTKCALSSVVSAVVAATLLSPASTPLMHGKHHGADGSLDAVLYFMGGVRGGRYDPLGSDPRFLRLQVRNCSGRALTLPERYDGRTVRLFAYPASESGYPGSDPLAPIELRIRGKPPAATIRVDDKEYADAFSLPLKEILNHDRKADRGNPISQYDWIRNRPVPIVIREPFEPTVSVPSSVFEKEPVVVFWAEITIDKQVIRTRPIILVVWQQDHHPEPSKEGPPRR
jgi:hypothetical protein